MKFFYEEKDKQMLKVNHCRNGLTIPINKCPFSAPQSQHQKYLKIVIDRYK